MPERLTDHTDVLAARLRAAPRIWFGTDFDGTLAPITDDPAAASLPPETRNALATLASTPHAAVGIVSGRDIANLRRHIQLDTIGYAGNHGLEIEWLGERYEFPTAAAARPLLGRITAALAVALRPYPGAWVQDKGLSLTVHYRRAVAEHHQAVTAVVQDVFDQIATGSSQPSLALRPGILAWDIRPIVDWHKGSAAIWLRDRQAGPDALAIFLGDDFSDEDAFAALPDGITILVGPNRESNARFRVDGPDDVRSFLEWAPTVITRRGI